MVFPVLIRIFPKMSEVDELRIFPNTSERVTKYVNLFFSGDDPKFPKVSPKYYCTFKT